MNDHVPLTVVLFAVGDHHCALRSTQVREVLPLPRLSRAPTLPPPLDGFVNLAGEPVAVLDLQQLLGLAPPSTPAEDGLYAHLLLLNDAVQAEAVALRVTRAMDVVTLRAESLRPMDDASTLNGCVEAAFEHAGRFVHLLAAGRLLLAQERQVLDELRDAAARRLRAWEGSTA